MRVNPFTYGNPISAPMRFFGRQYEAGLVFSRLRNAEFESSSLVGERRVGKTSLLNYLAHPDVRHNHGLDQNSYIFVYEDLQMVDKDTTPVKLWLRLLKQMSRYCQDFEVKQVLEEIYETESINTFALADIFDSVGKKGQHVVFLLDEFEHVTKNQNFGPDFFYGLRSLATQRILSLITSSRRELIDLCHSEAIRTSPFFNIFANISLPPFTQVEAQNLIYCSLDGTNVSFTDAELNIIFQIAGFHPYFLQIACSFLFEAYSKNLCPNDRAAFLKKAFRQQATPQLDDYWRISDDQEKIVLTMLALLELQLKKVGERSFSLRELQDLYMHSTQTLRKLEKRGLLMYQVNSYSLFNSSFGEWICNEITNTVQDQQSYNDWLTSKKGVMEHLSSKTKSELGEILPKINGKYRDLIITWVSDPKNLITVAALLKAVLGFG